MNKISVVISAYNEEKNLPICLESVKGLADEIIVVDNQSTDQTAQIAKKFGAKVFSQPNFLMLNINKNFGFSKAEGDWILNLDADEELTDDLKKEIKEKINKLTDQSAKKKTINGYWFPRKNIIFGKWIKHSLWWPDYQLRLFKKETGKFPEEHVHETLEIDGLTEKLQNPLIHYNYHSLDQFLYKMQKIYVENEVKKIFEKKTSLDWKKILHEPISDFLKNYFFLKGYKDGQHGLIINLLQSCTPLFICARLWEKNGFPEKEIKKNEIIKEFKTILKEVNYWLLTAEMEEVKNPLKLFLLKIKRKFLI